MPSFNEGYGELTRVGKKMRKKLVDLKMKNNLRSITEASDMMADILDGISKKKRVRQKIIRELEF